MADLNRILTAFVTAVAEYPRVEGVRGTAVPRRAFNEPARSARSTYDISGSAGILDQLPPPFLDSLCFRYLRFRVQNGTGGSLPVIFSSSLR